MKTLLLIGLCGLMAACARDDSSSSRGGFGVGRKAVPAAEMAMAAPAPMVAMDAAAPAAPRPPDTAVNRTLAYEHNVAVEVSKDLLPTRMQEIQNACASNKAIA